MKLVLLISGLGCGGAERVLTSLANHWAAAGHQVDLVSLSSVPPFFPIDPRVRLRQLDLEHPSRGPVAAMAQLHRSRRVLRGLLKDLRPEGVISFTTRVNIKVLMAARGLGIPVVISERNDPRAKPLNRLWTWLRDRWYPRAACLVVQTAGVEDWFRDQGLKRLQVIPNPVDLPARRIPEVPGQRSGGPLILNVARLMPQKGQATLVRSVAALADPSVRLRILGDGPERENLRALGDRLGLGTRLELPGFVAEKEPHWDEASVFVLSSQYEGFPNALVEAMAWGLPCVSFDCPSGPADLIRPHQNGILVPLGDEAGLTAALKALLDDPVKARALGDQARQVALDLSLPVIARQWEELFQ